jgi:aminopeptidase N
MPREFAFPGTRDRYAPDRSCDVQHYRIELDLNLEEKSIAGRCSVRLAALGQARSNFELDAVELDITRVSVAGEDLAFTHDGRKLRLDFQAEQAVGEPITVDIDYQATPRRGLYFVGPDEHYPDKPQQVWTQGQDEDSRYWFPCFDSPIQKSTSEVIVTLPADWFALSNGVLMSDSNEQGRRRMHWRLDIPHSCYLITLAAAEFAEMRDDWQEIEVSYYVQPARRDDCMRTLAKTPEMIDFFSRTFGVRYPYNKYAQVFVADFIFGGMENTTATSLTDSVLLDERAAIDMDMESLVCHELAHQWFGDLLTCRDWGEGWLNEGFATYSEYLWRSHAEGRDAGALTLANFTDNYLAEDKSRYRRSIVTKRYEDPIDIFDRHLYDKAGRVVHMLRCVLGDDDFFASIRHYLESHRAGAVETRDLARAIDRTTGRCLDWFFDQWLLRGSGHPEIKANFQWHADKKVLALSVEQTQECDDKTPIFRIPTRVRLVVDGTTADHEVELIDARHGFTFACASEPEQAIFDPGKHILGELSSTKSPAMWLAQLREAEEGIDRIAAARECARLGGKKAEEALKHSLQHDEFWGVSVEAARGLGKLLIPSARDTLVHTLQRAKHPKVRRAAAAALGGFLEDDVAASALIKTILYGDESYFVEAECCHGLGKTRDPRALEVLEKALTRDSFMDIIRQNVYQGLAALRDDSAFELLMRGSEYGQHSFGRRAAMRALASLASERKDGWARRTRERLIELIDDSDFRVQGQAITSLGALGDPSASAALSAVISEGFDSRLKRQAQEAVRSLKEGSSQNAQIGELRTQTEALQKQVMELRGRLDLMETSRSQTEQSRERAGAGVSPTRQRRKGGKKTIPA